MKKNKIIAISMVMTLSLSFTLTGCSNNNNKSSKVETSIVETGAPESSTPDEYTIEDDQYNVKNVIINDIDPLIHSFWYSILKHKNEFIDFSI